MKKNIPRAYETYDNQNDFEGIAGQVIEMANAFKMPIDQSQEKVANRLKTDLSDALPERLLGLIGIVAQAIENMEDES